jgi:signal recognition particle subunit SRP54
MKKKQKNSKENRQNEFGFDDFLTKSTGEKMGNMKDLVGMIPGASKAMKDVKSKMMLSSILRLLFIL